jgi:hypothetical protein
MKIIFGTVSNDYLTLKRVLLSSDLDGTGVYEHQAETATKGWNEIIEKAESEGYDIAVLCHQDVFFPDGWFEKFKKGIEELPASWLIAGFFGMDVKGKHCGRIFDRRFSKPLYTVHDLPCQVLNVDGCAFVVKLNQGLRFEEMPGFDLYDVYAGLKAKEMGRTVWVIDAPPEHWATRAINWKPDEKFLANWNWLKQRFPDERIISTCYNDKT